VSSLSYVGSAAKARSGRNCAPQPRPARLAWTVGHEKAGPGTEAGSAVVHRVLGGEASDVGIVDGRLWQPQWRRTDMESVLSRAQGEAVSTTVAVDTASLT